MTAATLTAFGRARQSDLWLKFRRAPLAMLAAVLSVLFFAAAALAPLIAPHTAFDPSSVNLADAFTPPAWTAEGQATYLLGTDEQGRDLLSTILYGARTSLGVGVAAVLFSVVLGTVLGLVSAYFGGALDSIIMRTADIQLTFPPILVALLIDGVSRVIVPRTHHDALAIYVVVIAIGLANWVQYARIVRSTAMVELAKDYVQAARVTGASARAIMFGHVLPNVLSPVLVIGTLGLALAMINEATLSYLGVGMPPTEPSLGTLIRIGNDFLFSGEWWITVFPGATLVGIVLSINLVGDWLRDALNPKLR